MADLRVVHIDIDAAQRINRVRQTCKTYGDKIRNVQVEIHIQHIDCHFRAALCIGCITFIVRIVTQIQIRVSVY